MWKCYHSRLPTRDYLGKIGINIDTTCPICKDRSECLLHIFWECKVEKYFWESIGIFFSNPMPHEHWVDFLRKKTPHIPTSYMTWEDVFPFTLWSIWKNRNENNVNNTNLTINTTKVFQQTLEYQLLTAKHTTSNISIKVKVK